MYSYPNSGRRYFFLVFFIFTLFTLFSQQSAQAQIFEPEGLNMPGGWNGWSNPPTNPAFASSTQVSGGRESVPITIGKSDHTEGRVARWQPLLFSPLPVLK